MKKLGFMSLAVAAVLCAGFVSCGDDDDDEPQNTITENTTGGGSGNGDSTGNDGNDNGGSDNGGNDSGYTPANPETDEYGIAVSKEVDLGLSVNWAGWNVGATAPDEYGGYYAWGETEEKEEYSTETYEHYDHVWQEYRNIGEDISGTEYDVAHVMWGDGWHMPTETQIRELFDKCTWAWITYNDTVKGYRVTGPNGNRIFLPAAGYRYGTSLTLAGSHGHYWSSTLNSAFFSSTAIDFYFYSGNRIVFYSGRYDGQSVRPVKGK